VTKENISRALRIGIVVFGIASALGGGNGHNPATPDATQNSLAGLKLQVTQSLLSGPANFLKSLR
jgi:hypothetical protein